MSVLYCVSQKSCFPGYSPNAFLQANDHTLVISRHALCLLPRSAHRIFNFALGNLKLIKVINSYCHTAETGFGVFYCEFKEVKSAAATKALWYHDLGSCKGTSIFTHHCFAHPCKYQHNKNGKIMLVHL